MVQMFDEIFDKIGGKLSIQLFSRAIFKDIPKTVLSETEENIKIKPTLFENLDEFSTLSNIYFDSKPLYNILP